MAKKKLKALVVDDDISLRSGAAEMLRDLGFEVETASSAKEAIAKLKKGPTKKKLPQKSLLLEKEGVEAKPCRIFLEELKKH